MKVTFSEKRGTYRWYSPVFAHEGNTLSADSADYNQGDNFFDAYGNVVITQPNGTVAYADKLHYTESSQEAKLTNNVRLIDPQATLSTNFLTYNMRTKIGTYVNGGKIINGTDTLTSKNGYYFENSQDAYFRYNVVVKSPDVKIITDTLRYNSGSKMTYFYGPTTIDSKNGRLYTENGDYNTETEKARFGKNNLYTEGSKFLWGDSLLYDGKSGNGKAIKNVSFVDTSQHIVMRGQLGTYAKATQTTLITQNAYIVIATKSDSTENNINEIIDQKSLSTDSDALGKSKFLIDSVGAKSVPDTSVITSSDSSGFFIKSIAAPKTSKMDSTFMSADTLLSQVIKLKDYKYANLKVSRDGGALEEDATESMDDGDTVNKPSSSSTRSKEGKAALQIDSTGIPPLPSIDITPIDSLAQIKSFEQKLDSLKSPTIIDSLGEKLLSAELDSLILEKAKNEIQTVAKPLVNSLKKASAKKQQIPKVAGKKLTLDTISFLTDSIPPVIPQKGDVDSLINQATRVALTSQGPDSLVSDTAETRIVIAYHDVRIFKSDLQAIADSAYFGYPDSIIRCFGKPIIWAQGSQLSADTVYIQLKNQKLDNLLLQNKAFVVNTELDSTKYNQVKGKKISGFFKNNKMDRVFVDGNAESIYYSVEGNIFTGMARSISGRIKVLFNENKMTDVISIRKPSTTYYPIAKAPDDQEFLEGFLWKPELRPKSKKEVITRAHIPNTMNADEDSKGENAKPDQNKEEGKNSLKEGEKPKAVDKEKADTTNKVPLKKLKEVIIEEAMEPMKEEKILEETEPKEGNRENPKEVEKEKGVEKELALEREQEVS